VTTHTIIESLSAYEATRERDPEGNRIWWTTSPFLLYELNKNGELVRSPEQLLLDGEFDALAFAAKDFSKNACDYIQSSCSWAETVDFQKILNNEINHSFFVIFYKGLLLSHIIRKSNDESIECVGCFASAELDSLSLTVGRLETLFAQILSRTRRNKIAIIPHQIPSSEADDVERRVKHRNLGAAEKLLSVLNNTFSSLLYKVWRNLNSRGLWPFSGVRIWPKPLRSIHILKDCELIEEAFLELLLRGARVTKCSRLPVLEMSGACPEALPGASEASEMLCNIARVALAKNGIEMGELSEQCSELFMRRLLTSLDGLRINLKNLELGFKNRLSLFKVNDSVLTSSINPIQERLFASYCQSRGVTVSTVDHGLTFGFSEWSNFHASHTGMGMGTKGFYHFSRGADAVQECQAHQVTHIVGLPRVTIKPAFRGLQRLISRKMIGIGKSKHVVMIVCDAERNNRVYGPYQDNDCRFLYKTKKITELVCEAFPNSVIILKLYPTQRYIDEYEFVDLGRKYSNLIIKKNFEYRFMRFAADLTIVSSTQSTLGWVAGAGAPFICIDFSWARSIIDGLKIQAQGINGFGAVIHPDPYQFRVERPESIAKVLLSS